MKTTSASISSSTTADINQNDKNFTVPLIIICVVIVLGLIVASVVVTAIYLVRKKKHKKKKKQEEAIIATLAGDVDFKYVTAEEIRKEIKPKAKEVPQCPDTEGIDIDIDELN